jgi:uncharacterized Zn-finger protein
MGEKELVILLVSSAGRPTSGQPKSLVLASRSQLCCSITQFSHEHPHHFIDMKIRIILEIPAMTGLFAGNLGQE